MSRNLRSCQVLAMVGAVTTGDGRASVRTAPTAIADADGVCTLDVRSEMLREALTHVA